MKSILYVLMSLTLSLPAHARPKHIDAYRAVAPIVGGVELAANHPLARSTVALVIGDALCTGSIIDRDLVITAAHCLYGFSGNVGIVFANSIQAASRANVMTSTRYVVHPSYDPAKTTADQNDLSLIRLPQPLPAGFVPATLLPEGTPLRDGVMAVLAGYGISNATAKTGAGVLRATQVPVKNGQLGRTEAVLDQTGGTGACHGDSGGPAFLMTQGTAYLWGVTSRGYPNRSLDDCAHDVVYTQIDEQLNFINSAARSLRN